MARQFSLDNFASRGVIVDVVFYKKEIEDGGIPSPRFHFFYPMRPMNPDGTWGFKQHRVYRLDKDGNHIRDQNGKLFFDAVPTTDWGSPETLEYWCKAWVGVCNAKLEEKGFDVHIDHRSYPRQGVDLPPTAHGDATVRAMEKRGIRTEKGELNRWIKATNAIIRGIEKRIALLSDWIKEIKAELAKSQTPDLVFLLRAYYSKRSAGAYSQRGKISNLKEVNETLNYLWENGIYILEDLEGRAESHRIKIDSLKATMDAENACTRAIRSLSGDSNTFQWLKSVYKGLRKIKLDKPKAAYKVEHEVELKQLYAARRRLTAEFPDGRVNMKKLSEEYDALVQTYMTTYE